MAVVRAGGLAAPLCIAATLALCPSIVRAESAEAAPPPAGEETHRPIKVADVKPGRSGGGSARSYSGPRSGAAPRFVAPRSSGMATSRTGATRAPQKYVVPRTLRIQPQTKFRAPSRAVVPGKPPALNVMPKTTVKGLKARPGFKLQATRRAPAGTALLNRGWSANPGRSKPPGIAYNPAFKAGKSGWMHRFRPFYFKHDGHRWHRRYYTYFVGGLWYWYWYDVIADTEPAAGVYPDAVLPTCDLDDDECAEPPLVAPALLEGRATQAAIDRCAAEFASFDPDTGTYVGADGEPQVCPYLQ